MDLGLRDRVFIVTGGSKGLGRATAEVLVEEGARLVLCARDEETVAKAAADLGTPDTVIGVSGDIGQAGTETRLVAAAVARYGRLDGALVSVGGPPAGSAIHIEDDAWRAAFESVFLGAVRVSRAVATAVEGGDGGSIALVLSTSVRSPLDGLAISNGLRPGLAMVAKTMADELASRGVRVNSLVPGRFDTDRVRQLDAASGRPVGNRR